VKQLAVLREDHRDDGREAALWRKSQLGQPQRIDDGFDRAEQDFDEEAPTR
jgi:hypothetical protein